MDSILHLLLHLQILREEGIFIGVVLLHLTCRMLDRFCLSIEAACRPLCALMALIVAGGAAAQ